MPLQTTPAEGGSIRARSSDYMLGLSGRDPKENGGTASQIIPSVGDRAWVGESPILTRF